MTGVTHEATCNVVCVLETAEDVIHHRRLGSLSELHLGVLCFMVDALHPEVVVGGVLLRDVLLELDDVVIWDLLGIYRGDDGCCVAVDRVDKDRRR